MTKPVIDNPVLVETGDASHPDSAWRIRGWSGEFADPALERNYLLKNQQLISRQLQLALMVWAALTLLFALPDYFALGASQDFILNAIVRFAVASLLIFFLFCVRSRPHLALQGRWITALELLGITIFMGVYFTRPDIVHWTFTLTLIMLVSIFVFVPNRIPLILGVAFYTAFITAFVMGYVSKVGAKEMVGLLLLLFLPIGTGWAAALRTQVLQRKQFALWLQTQLINDELVKEVEERSRLQEALVRQATTDPLTGLNNRRQYESLFQLELTRAERKGQHLSVCILDLDHFKQINDTHGHSVGDQVLVHTAELCRDSFRIIDILGRLGGEEFVVLMADTDLETAAHVVRRFLSVLAATPIHVGDKVIHVTATAGVVERRADEHALEELIQRADRAMYEGKSAGRNQVVKG